MASLDASLRRMGLAYIDIFYHHRPDPATPLAETLAALDQAVRSGRALYAGISNYPAALAAEAVAGLAALGTPCLVHQGRYSMLDRTAEGGLLDAGGGWRGLLRVLPSGAAAVIGARTVQQLDELLDHAAVGALTGAELAKLEECLQP